ncbi:Probable ribosomal protein S11, mitochondrial [Linum perenne]
MKSMDYVRSIIDESAQFTRLNANEGNEEVVHIKLLRNNTFITVTDQKGNTKAGGLKASSGMVPELKGGPKLSRYVAEATSEHVGRKSREMGLRSVVIKVNGFTFFKKKRQAIMSFKEGFGHNIAAIEDTTRKPHNGCRLRKKRRI